MEEQTNKRKQIPFRYEPELEKDLEEVLKLQHWSPKKNVAITQAIKIAAGYIKKQRSKIKKP